MGNSTTNNTTDSKQEAPERIRLVKRDGIFDGHWYYPDAAIMPFDTEIEYVRASLAAPTEYHEVLNAAASPTSPRCPKCGYVMCQQFDSRPVNATADIATPNGKYICYYCTPAEPRQEGETAVVAREFAREWMNTHHASFKTNQEREDALAAIITRYLVGTPSPVAEIPHEHRWVGRGEYGDTSVGYMCAACGVDLDDLPAAPVVADGDDEGEARRLLTECCYTINALADQQAMPDDFYKRTLEAVGRFMESDAAALRTNVEGEK